ncbi:hypothetical protein [Marinoscillum furvescens]|uniref:Uncharacterized protein n=1 Tax=Marinoscillum furvescens DSM 4134 TaxID=1122208 RepID=A0A3D9KYG9_MARFU|nr:hypothetical protein [Marinoscillum furvescens]RED92659.1 hypothetical protein C7460_12946 [Marinoscillum furvescens DSM 4134]
MKPLRYLSIQGSAAPTYWFKHHDAHSFRALVESITVSNCLLISSIYRTDIFYRAHTDKTDLLLKVWSAYKNIPFHNEVIHKFVRGSNDQESFEFYFDTLFHLMRHPAHYQRYKERLSEIQLVEPGNTILTDLMKCDLHLSRRYKNQEVAYKSLSAGNVHTLVAPVSANLHQFALEAIKQLPIN